MCFSISKAAPTGKGSRMFSKVRALVKSKSSRQPETSKTSCMCLDDVEGSHNDAQSDNSSRLNELGSPEDIEDFINLDPVDIAAPKDVTHRRDAIAVRNQAQSPLLRLPAELRNKIYNYCALNNREKLYFRIYQRNPFFFLELDQLRPIYYPGEENFFALSTVCRQLYSETALLPFSLNALVVEVRAVTIDLRLPSAAQQAVVRELSVHHSGEHSNWIAHENDGFVAALEGYKGLRKVVFEYEDLDDCVRCCHVGHMCFIRTYLRRKKQIEEKFGAQIKVELVSRHD